jgi:O-antigen/teichoic acid export membrane protein
MLKNLLYSLITKGTVALINFFILIFSSRYLGVTSRGEISIFILNITVIQVINEIYTGYSIVHFIPKFNFKKIIIAGVCHTFLFCSLSNLVIVFLKKQVGGNEWLGYLISLLVIINTFNCVLILGRQNIRIYNILSFIQPFLLLMGLLFFIFVLKKYTFVSYALPLLFSFSIAFIISAFLVSRFFSEKDEKKEFKLKPILVNGLVFQVTTLMFIFANRYSYYLLPDAASVGLYSSASSLMESVLIIVNSISPVLLARVANQGNTSKSIHMTLTLSKISLLFSTFAVVLIFLLPEAVFTFVLGEGFSGIRHLMLLYAPGILMVSLFGSISYYFSAIGQQKVVLICYSLGFISTLFLAPVFISRFKSDGAAYIADLTYSIMAIGICASFGIINKLSFSRFFSFSQDYKNFKELITSEP